MSVLWSRPSPEKASQVPARRWTGEPLYACFERMVEQRADASFVIDREVALTYGTAASAVRRLAEVVARSTPPARPIAVMTENGALFTIGMLACAAVGRPVVQLDAQSPPERMATILSEARVSAILIPDDAKHPLPGNWESVPVIPFNFASEPAAKKPARDIDIDIDAPFALGFTSGSTGRPKGVVFSQRQVLHLSHTYAEQTDLNHSSVLVSLASMSPASIRDVCAILLKGAVLHYVDIKQLGLSAGLRAWKDAKATHLTFVTSALRMIAAIPSVSDVFADMQMLSLIGEATTAKDIALFRRIMPSGSALTLGLGSSEAGPIAHWIVDDVKIVGALAPAGYVGEDRVFAIIGPDGNSVIAGEIGEFALSDEHVALGYWREGELIDSFSAKPGEPGPRTVRTGDMVRMREDGMLNHVGRADRMHKVRGLRVDLAEVEAALLLHAEVQEAAVVVARHPDQSDLMTAFMVCAPDRPPPSTHVLRRHIESETAPHMVPHLLRFLDELPRLHNGKPDLVRLAAMAHVEGP